MKVPAGEFKAKCLKIMEEVREYHTEVIITKFGKPVAKLVPIQESPEKPIFGYLKGSVEIQGDILATLGENWEAD